MRLLKSKKLWLLVAVLVIVLAFGATALADGEEYTPALYGTFWALLPPVIAIVLALITKEVYLSLFAGILVGAFMYANANLEVVMITLIDGGLLSTLTDGWNEGILIFTVMLGIVGVLMFRSGGAMAYGKWAEKKIKTRHMAQFATIALGVLIFVDDYFNCLTVGSVMRPLTDKHRISRAKLAYIVDATAAPVCMIAPISSWAAAVTGVIQGYGTSSYSLFMDSIPFNFYCILTIIFMLGITFIQVDYGPMRTHEQNAIKNNDLYTTENRPYADAQNEKFNEKGKVIDLFLPLIGLVILCVLGLGYTGGLFAGETLQNSLANCDASLGLVYGCLVAMALMFIYFMCRRVITLKEFGESWGQGFKNMVPAILILIFAWTLSGITGGLGAAEFVAGALKGAAAGLSKFLPFIIFLVACGLSFATGTSWGTFGILLPIVIEVFKVGDPLLIVGVSATLAGAVCGDHCSPISDTTIMASAGAQSDHINHVNTQLPYALTVAAISAVMFLISGFVPVWYIVLPIGIIITLGVLFILKKTVASHDLTDLPAVGGK